MQLEVEIFTVDPPCVGFWDFVKNYGFLNQKSQKTHSRSVVYGIRYISASFRRKPPKFWRMFGNPAQIFLPVRLTVRFFCDHSHSSNRIWKLVMQTMCDEQMIRYVYRGKYGIRTLAFHFMAHCNVYYGSVNVWTWFEWFLAVSLTLICLEKRQRIAIAKKTTKEKKGSAFFDKTSALFTQWAPASSGKLLEWSQKNLRLTNWAKNLR